MPICESKHDGSPRTFAARKRGIVPGRYKFAAPIDNLEKRLMFAVSYDANGWTVVTPSVNSKIIYVAPTGSDNNTGLSQSAPVASFKKAESLLVSGQPDEILLESGQTYNDSFQNWVYSGQDVNDPLLISYYNPTPNLPVVLPVIDSGTSGAGFGTPINQPSNNAAVNYLDVIGLNFQANLKNPSASNFNASSAGGGTGFYFYNPGGNVLLEDDTFEYYRYNIDVEALEGPINGITVRRCVDDYAYGIQYSHSQGLYAYNISNLSVVQSVFDHDGWTTAVSTSEDLGFNHDIYIASTCSGIIIQQNVLAEAAFAGIMARAGGQIDNNLFIDDAIAVAYGQANGADSTVGGVTGTLSGNVMVGDKTYDDGQLYGQGFDIGNIMPINGSTGGLVVSNNIITQDTENAKPAIQLDPATGTDNPSQCVGVNNVTITNNVTDSFREGLETDGRFEDGVSPATANIYAWNSITVTKNDFINATAYEVNHPNAFSSESWSSDNYYDSVLSQSSWITVANQIVPFSTWISSYDVGAKALLSLSVFPNPYVSIASYDATLGGPGTFADFLANADKLSISNYQTQYLALAGDNYIEAGFGQPLDTSTGNGGSGGTGGTGTGPPTASASTLNLNDSALGSTSYTFTVNYTDANSLLASSLNGGDLLVTGPNGFTQYAAFQSEGTPSVDANGYQHVAVSYQIVAPNGAWTSTQGGTYAITMLPSAVFDSVGLAVPAGEIGSFVADFTPPTAVATVQGLNTSTQGSNPFSFTISYTDPVGVDTTSIDNYSVKVTGPGTYSKYATVSSIVTSGSTTVATYSVAPSGSSFATGTYSITMVAGSVSDLDGNTVVGGTLATFIAQAGGGGSGTASITGTVFNDANGDGILDDRENTFTGVEVFLDLAGTGVLATGDTHVTTNSSGVYTFSNLSAGQYTVIEVAPSGSTVTTPTTGADLVTLTTGQAATNANFANQLNTSVTSGTGGSNSSTGSTATGTSGTTVNSSTGIITVTGKGSATKITITSVGNTTSTGNNPVVTTGTKPAGSTSVVTVLPTSTVTALPKTPISGGT